MLVKTDRSVYSIAQIEPKVQIEPKEPKEPKEQKEQKQIAQEHVGQEHIEQTEQTEHKAKLPGTVLFNDFMKPLGWNANRLALALQVPSTQIGEILKGRRSITPVTAIRLSRLLGTTAKFWVDLQADYELAIAKERWEDIIAQQIQPLNPINENARTLPSSKRIAKKKLVTPIQNLPILTDNEATLYRVLSNDPIHSDDLCQLSGMSAETLAATLTFLELSNLVARHPGDRFSKTAIS